RHTNLAVMSWNTSFRLISLIQVAASLTHAQLDLVPGYPTFRFGGTDLDITTGHLLREGERELVGILGLASESMHELRLGALVADGFVGDPDLVPSWGRDRYQEDAVEATRRPQIRFDPLRCPAARIPSSIP